MYIMGFEDERENYTEECGCVEWANVIFIYLCSNLSVKQLVDMPALFTGSTFSLIDYPIQILLLILM